MLSNPEKLEIYKQLTTAQEKYIYFLLAASASAIGFAMTQTKAESLSMSHILLAFAILSWVISFFSGLKSIENTNEAMSHNFTHIQFVSTLERYERSKQVDDLIEKAKSDTDTAIKKKNKLLNIFKPLQSYSLIFGALFYIIWHIVRMYHYIPKCL
jgi:hypothetical protein